MPKEYINIPGILEIKQPIGLFLVGKMKANDLLKITQRDPRHYNIELDKYIGIQREIDTHKIEQLRKFILTKDAAFPNSIIGTLSADKFEYDEGAKLLKIEIDSNSFAVIDGQHRLASFEDLGIQDDFELIVTFFLGIDLEEQAYLFSIINMTQKKLNPSLVQDLTELFTITTPEKLAHNLAKIFNNDRESPWFEMIKMLGKKESTYTGMISQYSFTKGILNLITDTDNYYEIRDVLKRENNKRAKLSKLEIDREKFIFWEYYVNEYDDKIYDILKAYFVSMKIVFNAEWGNSSFILTKTTGYNTFMKYLRDLYFKSSQLKKELDTIFFEEHLNEIKTRIHALTSDNYPPGFDGENKLYADLLGQSE